MAQQGKRIGTWVILGLLFVGLIGFGATGLSGRITNLGTVGTKTISVNDYVRELNGQIQAFSSQTGQPIPFSQALQLGIDRFALGQLTATRSLDNEAARIGLSVGDDAVAREILSVPAFQSGGSFSRDAYAFALEREGLSEAEFETRVREDIARTILQGSVVGGVPAPIGYAEALSRYVGEARDIRYILIGPDMLDVPPFPPSPEELGAYHRENAALFTAPELRKIEFVSLTPAMLQDSVEIDETALEDLYQDRISEFVQPERRLVERLVMPDEATANEALAQISAGGMTFDTVVADRGLRLSDVDLGDVTEAELGPVGADVFSAEIGAIVGPLASDLGPAIYRVNAVLDAVEVSFDEARPDLREELAAASARRSIDASREGIEDLIAGGAGIVDLATNTDMTAGAIDWTVDVSDGIAAYAAFREAAVSAEVGGFPELLELEDGGIFALTLTEIVPPALRPLPEVRQQVMDAWLAEATAREVDTLAERFASLVIENGDFTESMPEPVTETGLSRRSFLADAPVGLIEEVFGVSVGGIAMAAEDGQVALAILDAIREPGSEDTEFAARSDAIAEQAAEAIAQDLLQAFMTRVQERTDVSIDQAAITAVHANFQ